MGFQCFVPVCCILLGDGLLVYFSVLLLLPMEKVFILYIEPPLVHKQPAANGDSPLILPFPIFVFFIIIFAVI